MKEATGELNGSVIVFTAVALLTAFFFMFLWPVIRQGMEEDANCANAVCENAFNEHGMSYCYNPEEDPGFTVFECPFRG